MTKREFDTSTMQGLRDALEHSRISQTRLALLIGAPEDAIRSWLRGRRPVHPTASVMLDWILDGYRPPEWHMTGPDMADLRASMGMSQRELADVLDVSEGDIDLWESDFHGPPGFVARAIQWLSSDKPPSLGATDSAGA